MIKTIKEICKKKEEKVRGRWNESEKPINENLNKNYEKKNNKQTNEEV